VLNSVRQHDGSSSSSNDDDGAMHHTKREKKKKDGICFYCIRLNKYLIN
jgi:hypothetical protein